MLVGLLVVVVVWGSELSWCLILFSFVCFGLVGLLGFFFVWL